MTCTIKKIVRDSDGWKTDARRKTKQKKNLKQNGKCNTKRINKIKIIQFS